MKRIRIVKTKPAKINWPNAKYKKINASKYIYANILFLVNSKKIYEVEFYDKTIYYYFREKDKIRISDKCINKHLYLLQNKKYYERYLYEKSLYR